MVKLAKSWMFLFIASLVVSAMATEETQDTKGCQMKSNKKVLMHADQKMDRPYSAGIQVGNMVFLSGVLGTDLKTNELVSPNVGEQTDQCLKKFELVLKQADMSLSDAVSVIVFLADLKDFEEMNKAYIVHFPKNPPARACVQAGALLKNAKVEISMIAVKAAPETVVAK
jgi:2-iminobutanoate/2-iminopropanoate deaminase